MPAPALDVDAIGPPVGSRFPDIVLPDQTGQTIDLHRRRRSRKALVVFIRSASW